MVDPKIDDLQVKQIARQIKNSILDFCNDNVSAFEAFKKKYNDPKDQKEVKNETE